MALRSTTILAGIAALAALALVLLLWNVAHGRRALEGPGELPSAGPGEEAREGAARLSADGSTRAPAATGAPAEHAAGAAPQRRSEAGGYDAIVAEGRSRQWQLPLGKGWWTDTLINPAALEFDLEQLPELQERALTWIDKLRELKDRRSTRLMEYCRERVAAGLALENPRGAPPDDGREHMTITMPRAGQGNVTYRVDVAAGDDARLDSLDHQTAESWYTGVEDLRRWIEAHAR